MSDIGEMEISPFVEEEVDDPGSGEVNEELDEDKPDEEQEDGEVKRVAPVKRIHRPQPKLDAERLKGTRGLNTLQNVFKDVKFQGTGHEKEDLDVLLKRYEYWCHRLFPKMPFDDCIEKIEKLGTKKAVQTYVKLIRMDMVVDDTAPPALPEEEEEQQQQPEDTENGRGFDEVFPELSHKPTEQIPEISEEQLERIRINRERAQQRRQEMLVRASQTSELVD